MLLIIDVQSAIQCFECHTFNKCYYTLLWTGRCVRGQPPPSTGAMLLYLAVDRQICHGPATSLHWCNVTIPCCGQADVSGASHLPPLVQCYYTLLWTGRCVRGQPPPSTGAMLLYLAVDRQMYQGPATSLHWCNVTIPCCGQADVSGASHLPPLVQCYYTLLWTGRCVRGQPISSTGALSGSTIDGQRRTLHCSYGSNFTLWPTKLGSIKWCHLKVTKTNICKDFKIHTVKLGKSTKS